MADKEKIIQLLRSRDIDNINNAILIGCIGQNIISVGEVCKVLAEELKGEFNYYVNSEGSFSVGYSTFIRDYFRIYLYGSDYTINAETGTIKVVDIGVKVFVTENRECIYHSEYPQQQIDFDPKILEEAVFVWVKQSFKDCDFC